MCCVKYVILAWLLLTVLFCVILPLEALHIFSSSASYNSIYNPFSHHPLLAKKAIKSLLSSSKKEKIVFSAFFFQYLNFSLKKNVQENAV